MGIMIIFSMGVLQTSSAASNVSVNTTGNDTNTGTSSNPYQTISTGINNVDNNGTVKLSSGTFNLNNGVNHTDYGIKINKNVTIQGNGSNKTFIDAKNINNIFTIQNNSNVVIRDLTIENGYSVSGGAITNSLGSNLTLINCIITNNQATKNGGAIYNSGNLNITSSILVNNSVTNGYANDVYNNNGTAEIHFNSILDPNAIYNNAGTVNAQNNWWGTNNNPGTELENFNDINNWKPMNDATTISVNTVNGDTGVKVVGTNGSYPGIIKQVNYNFGGIAPKLQVWLYLDDGTPGFELPTQIIDIGINLYSSITDKYFETFLLQSQLHKGLNYIAIPTSNFVSSGGMTWNDTITAMQFHIFYNPRNATNITFLEVKKDVDGVPKVVLTFDDGYENIFTTAFPIMQQYGIVGTIYLNENLVGTEGRLTLAELHILHDAGWIIANHTPDHTDLITGSTTGLDPTGVTLTVDQIKTIVQSGMDWLIANGFGDGADHFALPWGQYNDNVLEALRELGVKTDRTVMLRYTTTPADDLLQICQEGPNGGDPINTPEYTPYTLMNKFVDNAIESKTTMFVMLHEITDNPTLGRQWATSDLTQFIQHIVQTGIETENIDQWYNDTIGVNYSIVNYSPWIVLSGSASTNSVPVSGISTITADLTHNSDGQDISSLGHIPDGIKTNFVSDSLGTVNPTSAMTINGKATTTYTAGSNTGNSTVNASVDNQNINIGINITGSVPVNVVSIDPVNGALNVPTNKVINITFNVPIKSGSAYNNIKIVNNSTNTAQTITKTITNNILTITSSAWQQGITYTLTIPANSITDLTGNNLTNTYTSNFTTTTTTDTTPPTITSTDPANNTSALPTKIMTVTFSEPIQAGSAYGNIVMMNTNDNSVKDIITTISGNILTITPTYNWLNLVKYTLTIPANSISDLAGNGLSNAYTTSFKCSNVVDTTPPTITSTDPANNAINVPTNKVINITFSEPIQAGTAYNNIKIVNNNTNTAQTITKTITNNILTITSSAWQQGTTYTLTIPANSITDLTGNNLTNTYTSNFTTTTTTDTTPPTITSTDPANNAINVPTNKVINITFSEPIQAGTAYNNIKIVNNNTNTAQTITKTITNNILTITSSAWQQGITYTLTIPANSVTDLTGNNLTNTYTSNFTATTTADTTPPTITSTDPANNTSALPTKIMTVTFSEPIQAGSAYSNIVMMNTNDNSVKDIITTISGNILTITPTYNWLNLVKYTLTIPANSISNLAGNGLSNAYTTSFKCSNVVDTTPPTITSTDPANNAINVPTNKVINITFSEPIQAGTAYNNIKIVNNNTNTAQTITKTITNNILTITSSAWQQGTTYTLTIPANSITDLTGNNLTNTYTSNFTTTTTTDTTPPTITSTDPANNAINVPTNKVINITFSEPIQAGTAYNNIKIVNNNTNTAQTITKTITNNILTITSSAWQQGITYTLTIPANSVTDLTGNNLTNTYTSNFTATTTADTTPPTITSTDPANNTSALPTKIMTVTFSEPIQAGSAYSNISMLNTYENAAKDIVTSISGNILTITPTYNWLQFVKYTLTIPANSITDLAGNNLVATYTTSFTIS